MRLGSIGAYLHSESGSDARRRLSGVSQADDSQLLPVQFHQIGIPIAEVGIICPTPVTVGIGIMAYTLGDVQYMRKDHLGNGSGAVGRYVGDNDAPRFRSLDVHNIISCSQHADVFQGGQSGHILRRNHRFICNQHFRSGRTLQ